MLTTKSFLQLFPEFISTDAGAIKALIIRIGIQTRNYCGFDTVEEQDLALALHVAHYIQVRKIYSNSDIPCGEGREILSIKSNNDQITFARNDDRFGFANSEYGLQLQQMIDNQYDGGFGVHVCW